MNPGEQAGNEVSSPDNDDRIRDFMDRHGGPSGRGETTGLSAGGLSGWSENYAADGYILRCEWSKAGDRHEMQFVETPPRT